MASALPTTEDQVEAIISILQIHTAQDQNASSAQQKPRPEASHVSALQTLGVL